jgi:predicted metal-binding membrane protein
MHHGAFCAACCWALMLIQLMLGVMNLAVMVTVGVVIALEKLISRGELGARITGVVSILGGIALAASSIMGWHLRSERFRRPIGSVTLLRHGAILH